jgi:hypothetical protein
MHVAMPRTELVQAKRCSVRLISAHVWNIYVLICDGAIAVCSTTEGALLVWRHHQITTRRLP